MFNDAVHVNYIYKAETQTGRVSKGNGGTGHGHIKYYFCGRSDFYGCVWGKSGRNPDNSCKADPSQRGDSDCVKASVRSDCTAFLSSAL